MAREVGFEGVRQTDDTMDFETIYTLCQPRIAGYLCRMVGDPDVAADLTQDVFVKAYRAIGQTKPGLNVKAWLFTIATNAAFDHHRRHRLLKWLPLGVRYAVRMGGDPQDRVPAKEELQAALAELPKDQLACLLLQARDGFSFEEIGAMLSITAGAAKTRAYRARWALARTLSFQQKDTSVPGEGRQEDTR
ncbi:MAG: RNA polymerase sigma factor [Chloroflexi bacterium]|nr:RNA polymerase sigma factor [Chloroflexota bacterium]